MGVHISFIISQCLNWAPLGAQIIKNLLSMRETQVQPLGRDDPLERKLAAHSSIVAWKIPWTEQPGDLQSMYCKESNTTEQRTHTVSKLWSTVAWVLIVPVFSSHFWIFILFVGYSEFPREKDEKQWLRNTVSFFQRKESLVVLGEEWGGNVRSFHHKLR